MFQFLHKFANRMAPSRCFPISFTTLFKTVFLQNRPGHILDHIFGTSKQNLCAENNDYRGKCSLRMKLHITPLYGNVGELKNYPTVSKYPKYSLTHFSPMSHFYTPWKRQKTYGFLTFSGGMEMWHWTKIG